MVDTLMRSVHAVLREDALKAQKWRAGCRRVSFEPDLPAAYRKADCQMVGLAKWLADKAQEVTP